MHPQVHDPAHIKGVRTVATIEFTKGMIVVAGWPGRVLHAPQRHLGSRRELTGISSTSIPIATIVGVFIDLVYGSATSACGRSSLVASIYVILRFIEAYGLWYVRPWAEWLAIASGSIYIPFEIADLLRRPNGFDC